MLGEKSHRLIQSHIRANFTHHQMIAPTPKTIAKMACLGVHQSICYSFPPPRPTNTTASTSKRAFMRGGYLRHGGRQWSL